MVVVKNKIANDGRCNEARKGENVRNRINIFMWCELSEYLEERLIGLRRFCSERRKIDSAHVTSCT